MAQLQVNGLQIEYDTFGEPGADPILLIMGLGTQMTAWSPDFCNALVAHGHYVIRFDNRDIGLSTKFEGAKAPSKFRYVLNHFLHTPLRVPYSLEDMASDAAGVLEALDIESAHVVGASMGGMIAQLMTVNHPERVNTLTSIMSSSGDPGLAPARPDVVKHVFSSRPNTGDANAMLKHLTKTAQLISSPAYPRSDEDWHTLITAAVQRSFYPMGFVRQMAAIVADGSRVERLRTIDKPTLVIHGSADPLVPVESGIDTARHIRGARLEIIEGMGHDIPPQLVDKLTSMIAAHAKT
ncbi:MAG: alpha/beta fold hydrolase [Gammaproteobacteria bacterium]|nr:alpha/beta fold hydrolase [Gammaproteobacteria bacterium]MDH3372646.1 alpha/beta fold hydrolase [Gammaproteobacteria bacterium]MDH3410374.1 alpha/beta fold hydrolase [Gammaproteobacteria bacterium]MDH3553041.1 alpha/beta fold hydrolase [Gammaproteobacteria bacterium]